MSRLKLITLPFFFAVFQCPVFAGPIEGQWTADRICREQKSFLSRVLASAEAGHQSFFRRLQSKAPDLVFIGEGHSEGPRAMLFYREFFKKFFASTAKESRCVFLEFPQSLGDQLMPCLRGKPTDESFCQDLLGSGISPVANALREAIQNSPKLQIFFVDLLPKDLAEVSTEANLRSRNQYMTQRLGRLWKTESCRKGVFVGGASHLVDDTDGIPLLARKTLTLKIFNLQIISTHPAKIEEFEQPFGDHRWYPNGDLNSCSDLPKTLHNWSLPSTALVQQGHPLVPTGLFSDRPELSHGNWLDFDETLGIDGYLQLSE